MGAWTFVEPRLYAVLDMVKAGQQEGALCRAAPASASTATGLMSKHVAQRDQFLEEALG